MKSILCVALVALLGLAYAADSTPVYKDNCFFDVQKDSYGIWWLVDPNGKTFWSRGTDVNIPSGEKDKTTGEELYKNAVYAKYGNWQNWSDYQTQRFLDWDMNTLGAWTSEVLYDNKLPYVEELGIYSQWKADWADCNGCYIPDVYDPGFPKTVRKVIRQKVLPKINDPYYMGHILDNEIFLGPQYYNNVPLLHYYVNFSTNTYGWKAAKDFLVQYYNNDIKLLNGNWTFKQNWGNATFTFTSFDEINNVKLPGSGQWYLIDRIYALFVRQTASLYISTCVKAIKAADPNHLILGQKYNGLPNANVAWAEANSGVDVSTIDLYRTPRASWDELEDMYKNLEAKIPIIFGEFTYRGNDTGHPNSGGAGDVVGNQQARADNIAKLNYTIGAWWFQLIDQPKGGRGSDGESGNNGMVNSNDDEYQPLVQAMKKVNHLLESYHGNTTDLPAKCGPRVICPNDCSGNGVCNKYTGRCECHTHFVGGDCSYEAGYQNETYNINSDITENWTKKSGYWVPARNPSAQFSSTRAVILTNEGLSVTMNKTGCTSACGGAGIAAGNVGSRYTYGPGWLNSTLRFDKLATDNWDGLQISWYNTQPDGTSNTDGYQFLIDKLGITLFEYKYGTKSQLFLGNISTVDTSKFHVYSLFWGTGDTSVALAIDGQVLFNASSLTRVAKFASFDILYHARDAIPSTIGTNQVVQAIFKNIVYETEAGNVAPSDPTPPPTPGPSTAPTTTGSTTLSPSSTSTTGLPNDESGSTKAAVSLLFIAVLILCNLF